MLVECDKSNLYSKVTNKKYSNAREYLASTYGEPKVRYYNADTSEEVQTKKRHKTKYIALIITTISVCAGIAVAILAKNNKFDISKLEELAKTTSEKANQYDIKDKSSNIMSNFNNIKDDYWNKFTTKLAEIKPLSVFKKIGDFATSIYNKTVKKAFSPEWDKKALNLIEKANNEGKHIEIETFNNWYDNLSKEINASLHIKGERVTDNLFKKDFLHKISSGNIADSKIHSAACKAVKKVEIPNGASDALIYEIENFNKYKLKTASTIVSKLRDINLGSAPTDVLNQSIALISLGVAIATSDTKEEKQSVMINLGLPLITTLTFTTYATIRAISGAAAFALGLITGESASILANIISKAYAKKHSQGNIDLKK